MTKEAKWTSVYLSLAKMNIFADATFSANSIQEKLRTEIDKILSKFGFTSESVNLSGLPDKPSDFESLLLTMAEEKQKETLKSRAKSHQEKLKQTLKNNTEQCGLLQQVSASRAPLLSRGDETTATSSTTPSDISVGAKSVGGTGSSGGCKGGTGSNSSEVWMERMRDEIMRVIVPAAPTITPVDDEYEREAKRLKLEILREELELKKEQRRQMARMDHSDA